MGKLNDAVQTRLAHPELQVQISHYLQMTYKYGYALGVRGLPLRWHNGLKLRGRPFIYKDHPEIKQAREMLVEEGKRLASIVFDKAHSTTTTADVVHLYSFIGFIDYETESITNRPGTAVQQKIERRVTTLNYNLAKTFIEDRVNKGYFDEAKAKRAYSALEAVQEEVLEERLVGNYLYPRVTFKQRQTTRHRTAISLKEPAAYAPVLMIQGYLKGLRKAIGNGMVHIYYTKVNQEIRKQTVTFNEDYIEQVYGDNPYVTEDFRNALSYDVTKVQSEMTVPLPPGVPSEFLMDNIYLWGGLWKVADFGASPLDYQPTRNISLLRIIRITAANFDAETYRRFTFVDLESTLPYFNERFDALCSTDPELAQKVTDQFIQKLKLDPNTTVGTLLQQLDYQLALGTTFRKALHVLITGMPDVFPDYTGAQVITALNDELTASDLPEDEIVELDIDDLGI